MRSTTMVKATRSWLIALLLAVLATGCGMEEAGEIDEETSSREPSFKHGTPPGPAPWTYTLTSYTDHSVPACGGKMIDGNWYYATGAWTFGCGSRLRLQAGNKCVVVAVVDNGPAAWVERKAKNHCGHTGYIIDASPLVSRHLFGSSSAGWSDCFFIEVTEVARNATPGPVSCAANLGTEARPASFIGEPCSEHRSCSTGLCLSEADGFPEGTCTMACDHLCPDLPNKPVTFCVGLEGQPRCLSTCNTTLHPGTGCRPGYRCETMARWGQPELERGVCVP